MKKAIVFIIVLLCAILCCSCSAKAPADSNVQGSAEATLTTGDITETIEFHITVNPELKLHTTAQGVVLSVQCLNEDAEKVCKDLKLEGKPYQEAFVLLVERMDKYGYLSKGEVIIRVVVPDVLGAQAPEWEIATEKAWISALEKQSASCSFSIGAEVSAPQDNADESVQDTSQNQIVDDEHFIKVERDSAGNITMTVEIDADGNNVTAYYDNYPNAKEVLVEIVDGGSERYFYDATGSIERQVSVSADGVTIESHYKNNVLVKEIVNGGDEERYYENGVLRREVQIFAENQVEKTYYADGKLESVVDTGKTITRTEEYHTDGWLQRIRFEDADGFTEKIYQADGVLLSEENSKYQSKFIYNMSGRKVEAYGLDNHGKKNHIFYLSDVYIVYVHEGGGIVSKAVFRNSDGSCLSEIPNYTGPETADVGTLVPPAGHQ